MLKNGIFCEMVILVVFKVFLVVKNLEILIQIVPERPIYYYCYFTGVTAEEFSDDWDDAGYYQWAKVDGKVKKVVKSVDVEEAIELFNEQVNILKSKESC